MSTHNERYERRRLRLLGRLAQGESVLDVGYCSKPNPYFEGRRVTGLDLEQPPRELPKEYGDCITGDVADSGRILADRTFDTVILGEVIEHVERPFDVLRAVGSCMHPESVLLLSTPNPLAPPMVWYEMMDSDRRYGSPEHVACYPRRWMRRMLQRSGFELVSTVAVGMGHPVFAVPGPAWLSYQLIYVARPVAR